VTGPVTGAALTLAAPAATDAGGEFGHVLNGVVLGGTAAHLARTLEPGFLSEAGWDPLSRVLSMPAEHPLLGRRLCRVDGCTATAHGTRTGGLCYRCSTRLAREGWSRERPGPRTCRRCRPGRPDAWCRAAGGCHQAAGRVSGPGCARRTRGGSAGSPG